MNEQGQMVEAGFAELFAESSLRLKEGEVVEGVVLAITDDHVQVDVGFKSEGLVDAWEFMEEDGSFTVKPGDRVDVFVEETEDLDGHIVLSKEKANRLKIWDGISSAYEAGDPVEGRILSRVKGGLSVDLGVKAFLPGSQVDLRPVGNLESLIGERMQFKIIKFNKRRGNIVLSRRVLLEKEREQMRATTLQSLEEGMIADGMVKNITDYGAFVDLGGIDGLLHVTDMSWGRINHPSELFKPGDELKVKVLKFDSDSERVSLGLKQIQPDPWVDAAMRYPVGMRVEGRVVSLTDYGAFVELEPGVEGLVHVSEMSWTKRVKHPGKVVSIGDEVQAVVLGVEEGNRRLSLGMKQTEPNPWDVIEEKYPLGTRVQGEVRSVTNFGLFVGLEEGIDGLVHVSDLSWTENIKHPGEKFEKGSQVEAVVLKIDRDNEKFSLGIKQLTENPWDQIQRRYPLGSEVNCEVSSVADFGVFVKLEEGIEGLIYAAELRAEAEAEAEAAEVKPGDQLTALVTRVDPVDQKIALSVKAASDARQRAELEKLAQQQAQAQKKTIGDLLKEKLAARKAPEQPDSEG